MSREFTARTNHTALQTPLRPSTAALRNLSHRLVADDFETYNFSRLAFRQNFERPATNFTISGKALGSDTGVNGQVEALTAIRTLDGFRAFHDSTARN